MTRWILSGIAVIGAVKLLGPLLNSGTEGFKEFTPNPSPSTGSGTPSGSGTHHGGGAPVTPKPVTITTPPALPAHAVHIWMDLGRVDSWFRKGKIFSRESRGALTGKTLEIPENTYLGKGILHPRGLVEVYRTLEGERYRFFTNSSGISKRRTTAEFHEVMNKWGKSMTPEIIAWIKTHCERG